mmetsp:Transcript_55148/g.131311  ORF Transcript_55148/g.131311 Transcript_55148/m.131311 type:complete len:217 (+) Transcript_55148:2340-2990(+)
MAPTSAEAGLSPDSPHMNAALLGVPEAHSADPAVVAKTHAEDREALREVEAVRIEGQEALAVRGFDSIHVARVGPERPERLDVVVELLLRHAWPAPLRELPIIHVRQINVSVRSLDDLLQRGIPHVAQLARLLFQERLELVSERGHLLRREVKVVGPEGDAPLLLLDPPQPAGFEGRLLGDHRQAHRGSEAGPRQPRSDGGSRAKGERRRRADWES